MLPSVDHPTTPEVDVDAILNGLRTLGDVEFVERLHEEERKHPFLRDLTRWDAGITRELQKRVLIMQLRSA